MYSSIFSNKILFFNSFTLFFIVACTNTQQKTNTQTTSPDYSSLKVLEKANHYIVVGDWGRNGYHNQIDVAERMQEVAEIVQPAFIISTGDHFYANGVQSVDDPMWISSFENIYRGSELFCDWYGVLGNHDYRGSVKAQLDYAKKSRRWRMSERYYTVHDKINKNADIDFVFIDTNPYQLDYQAKSKKYDDIASQDTLKQSRWIDSVLTNSTATWKAVIGHHPLYTTGKRVNDEQYMLRFESMFNSKGVDLYLCGHEHDLQYNQPEGINFHHFISGAGSSVRQGTELKSFNKFYKAVSGFMLFSFTEDLLLVQMIDYQGNIIYSTEIKK